MKQTKKAASTIRHKKSRADRGVFYLQVPFDKDDLPRFESLRNTNLQDYNGTFAQKILQGLLRDPECPRLITRFLELAKKG